MRYHVLSENYDALYAEAQRVASNYRELNAEYERVSCLYQNERSARMDEMSELRHLQAKDEFWQSIDSMTRINIFYKEDGEEAQVQTVFGDLQQQAEDYATEKNAVVNDPSLAPDAQGNAPVGGGSNDDPVPGPMESEPILPKPTSDRVDESQYQPKAVQDQATFDEPTHNPAVGTAEDNGPFDEHNLPD